MRWNLHKYANCTCVLAGALLRKECETLKGLAAHKNSMKIPPLVFIWHTKRNTKK